MIGVGALKISPKAKKYLGEVIRSNRISYGPFSEQFEKEFAQAHHSRFSVFVNSGTSALQISLQALKEKYDWSDGDEVLVPAVTFVATANVCLHNRLKPVFVDVHPQTYNLDPNQIERHITKRTRAIMPVHLTGLPCDMTEICQIAANHKLRIVEDSAECMFGEHNGRRVGSFGDFGCFSTYAAHFLVTGVGGLITTDDPDLAVRARSLANHGRDSIYISIDDGKDHNGRVNREVIEKRFSFTSAGHSFRCTELEAALGLAELEGIDKNIAARKRNAERLTAGLADLSYFIQLPVTKGHMWMMYPILARSGKRDLINHLEANGIETRELLPLINQPVYRKMFGNLDKEYPNAARINEKGLYFGCHQFMTNKEIDFIIKTIHEFYGGKH